jgi:hypothetical protein
MGGYDDRFEVLSQGDARLDVHERCDGAEQHVKRERGVVVLGQGRDPERRHEPGRDEPMK